MTVRSKKYLRRISWSLVFVIFVVAGYTVFTNRQFIQDSIAASSAELSSEILEIKENLLLTSTGSRVFSATNPTIENRERFNDTCRKSTHSDEGSLLGCYFDGEIHLFAIEDERLEGIMEVTAAHELLHAAYARMSFREKESFQKRSTEFYREFIKGEPEFEKRMSVYSGLSGARFANELHSVFATEVKELPEWLENHYRAWFLDRSIITDFYDSYSEVFADIQAEGEELLAKLTAKNEAIDVAVEKYSAEVRSFNQQWENFKARNESYEFSSNPKEFYATLEEFNRWRESLNAEKGRVAILVEEYESLREQLEELNHVSSTLRQSMDSALLPLSD